MEPEIRTEFVEANGLKFEVDMCGTGDKFAICLHGFPEHSHSWRYQLPMLAKQGYTAWAPNLRGYGNSSRPPKVADYKMSLLVSDVAQLIDAARAKSTLLIGHDWGGAIAWAFALQAARPLDHLIVMNLPHPRLFFKGLRTWRQLKKSWYIFFFQIPMLPEYMLGRNEAESIGNMFYSMAIDKSRFPREMQEFYRKNASQPGALTAMINYYRANFSGENREEQRQILKRILEIPTLLIWGEADTALGKELTYGTEKLVKDLTLRYLPDVSHWVQQEAPETVNELIETWLSGKEVPQVGAGGKLIADNQYL